MENPPIDWNAFAKQLDRTEFKPYREAIIYGLKDFERHLAQGFFIKKKPAQLADYFGYKKEELPELEKLVETQPHHLYFYPAITESGQIIVPVFLKSTREEMERRKKTLKNANKHLHHGFLTKTGMAKVPREFFETGKQLSQLDYTAYTKIYISMHRTGKRSKELAILMHPFQQAQLTYDPTLDSQYKLFNQRMNHTRNILMHASPIQENSILLSPLRLEMVQALVELQQTALHEGAPFDKAVKRVQEIIAKVPAKGVDIYVLSRKSRARQDPSKSRGHPTKQATKALRRILIQTLRDAQHARNMLFRKGEERPYASATAYTGKRREIVLFMASGVLRHCLESATQIPTRRYILSHHQLDLVTLKSERGNIREKIKALPENMVMRRKKPARTLPIKLPHTKKFGEFSHPTSTDLSVVLLDSPRFGTHAQQRKEQKQRRITRKKVRTARRRPKR